MSGRGALIVVNAVGGSAVLASYYLGASSPHAESGAIWGGVPEGLRGLYQACMLLAASGYFPFTWLLLFGIDPDRTRFWGHDAWLPTALYALVMQGSALWLPLTEAYLDRPDALGLSAVVGVLLLVAVGSLGLFGCLLRLEPAPPSTRHRLALAGCAAFCFQTVVLDAIVWVLLLIR